MDFGKSSPSTKPVQDNINNLQNPSCHEIAQLNLKIEMLEKDLVFNKKMCEDKLKRKDEQIDELKRENEKQMKIRAEIKKELIHKFTEIDNLVKETKLAEKKMKESENKSENLKLMLQNNKNVLKDLLVIFSNFRSYVSQLQKSDEELLEAVQERYQRNSLDQS